MAERDTLIRSMHDLGMAAWFGGSLMGAVGVNGAAGAAKDPTERLRLSSIGWAKWTPVQVAAIGVHAVGGIGLMLSPTASASASSPAPVPRPRSSCVLTAAAAGITAYSGVLGAKVAKHADEGAAGATDARSDQQRRARQRPAAAQGLPVGHPGAHQHPDRPRARSRASSSAASPVCWTSAPTRRFTV